MENYEFMDSVNLKTEKTKLINELNSIHARSVDQKLTKEDQYTWDSTMNKIEAVEYYLRDAVIKDAQKNEASLYVDKSNANKFEKKSKSKSNNLLGRIINSTHKVADEEVRSMTSSSGVKLIPTDRINSVIYDLTSQNDLFSGAGAQMVNMEQNTQYPRVSGYPTAYFQNAELDLINDSAPTITSVKADLKDIAVRIVVSNQLLLDADNSIDAEAVLQNAMISAVNQSVLESVFSGSGASGQPTGLDNLASILTIDAEGSKLTNYRWHISAVKSLLDANMPLQNLSVFGSPDSWQQLESLTDSTGQPLRSPNTIAEMRKFYTSAVKTDYGSGNDQTRLYFGDFTRMVMGYQPAISVITDNQNNRLGTEVILHFRYDLLYLSPNSFCRVDNIETGLPEYGI
jgi:HK97 family phage major capsid protein